MARKDDLKRVLRLGVGWGRGVWHPRTDLLSPSRATGPLDAVPTDQAWWPARLQVVWAQQAGWVGTGRGGPGFGGMSHITPLPPAKVHTSSKSRH